MMMGYKRKRYRLFSYIIKIEPKANSHKRSGLYLLSKAYDWVTEQKKLESHQYTDQFRIIHNLHGIDLLHQDTQYSGRTLKESIKRTG